MCPINVNEIRIDHIVDFAKDCTTFAAARQIDGRLRIFLINDLTGTVYTRNGRADSWEEVIGSNYEHIRRIISEARGSVPTYKINGTHDNN